MTTSARAALGAAGEEVAVRHLEAAGLEVLTRNWRCAHGDLRGEVDVVARDGTTVVVVEVKARRGDGAGAPAEAVTRRKLGRLRALAGAYLAQTGAAAAVRIDVVAVRWPRGGGTPEVTHLRAVDGW